VQSVFAISERDAAEAAHSPARRSVYVENGAYNKWAGVPEHGGAVRHCMRLRGYREYSRNVVRVIHRIVAVELTDRSVHGLVIMAVTVIMV
jgi:hypothetical protein